jgi:hypothetical protein
MADDKVTPREERILVLLTPQQANFVSGSLDRLERYLGMFKGMDDNIAKHLGHFDELKVQVQRAITESIVSHANYVKHIDALDKGTKVSVVIKNVHTGTLELVVNPKSTKDTN